MKYRYEDSFSKNYQNLPAAFYIHHEIGHSDALPNEDGSLPFIRPHNHAEMEVLLIEKGRGYCKIGSDDRTIEFKEGDLLILNPFEVHSGAYFADLPEYKHSCIDFSVSLLDHPLAITSQKISNELLAQSVRSEALIRPGDACYGELKACYTEMLDSLAQKRQNDLKFLAELYRFFNILHDASLIHRVEQSPMRQNDATFVRSVLEYINKHFTENISTRDIASELVYSKEHFCRLFKTYFSISFTDYLSQYRIEKAKLLLGKYSSSEVAEKCGFSSQSNFSRVFKEAVGISPTEYRKFLIND